MSPIKVGLLGLGVVGSGTWNVLKRNADEIARRAGRRIEVVAIAVRDLEKARALVGDEVTLNTDGMDVVRNEVLQLGGSVEIASVERCWRLVTAILAELR